MVEITGGNAAEGLVDVFPGQRERYPHHAHAGAPAARARRRGADGSRSASPRGLGFGCRWVPPDHFIVRVPYWRTDVTIADDVIEEVARILGYDEMPTTQLRGEIPAYEPQPARAARARAGSLWPPPGLQEIITYSMTDLLEASRRCCPQEDLATNPPLHIANPISREHEYARTTLRGSCSRRSARNTRTSGSDLLALFETGRMYLPREDDLPHEVETVCAAITGRRPVGGRARTSASRLLRREGLHGHALYRLHLRADYRDAVDFAYLPGRTAEVWIEDNRVGLVGQVHPSVATAFDIKTDVAMFELDLEALLPHVSRPSTTGLSRLTPRSRRTWPSSSTRRFMQLRSSGSSKAPSSSSAVSVLRSTPARRSQGKKSLAFSVSYQSGERTLSDADVARERARIVERLRRELNADLRA